MATDNQQAFGWFLAGLGIGALVGILYAPKSGRETRDDIVATAKDGTEYVRVRAREVADQASVLVERGKGFVNDQTVKVTAAVDAGKQAYQETTAAPGQGPLA